MSENRPQPEPVWRPCGVDLGRRRALLGLSAVAIAAVSSSRAWSQAPRRCVLTPEAGEGPFYLDPKLVRSDITSGQPGAPIQLSLQVVRTGDCLAAAAESAFNEFRARLLTKLPPHFVLARSK